MILAFGHRRGRGKNLAADFAANSLRSRGRPVRIAGFADAIKEGIGRGLFGLSTDQLYGDLKEVKDPLWDKTPRDILQTAGGAMRHAFGDDVFIKVMQTRIAQYDKADWVISDLRMPQEYELIRSLGGYCIRVDRECNMDPADTDYTEWALDEDEVKWDLILDNNGSKRELQDAVIAWLNDLVGKLHVNLEHA